MRFAVVGTNFISDNFCIAASSAENASVTAVFSRAKESGKKFAEKYGIGKVYTDYASMLCDGEIDAVYIASPTMCHAEQAIAALYAGKDVLCEKMISASYSEFLKMKDAANITGKVLIEAMRPDFDEILLSVSKSIEKIGEIKEVRLEYCQYSSRYDKFLAGDIMNAFDPAMKNSALADIGIYPLHFAVSLFGAPKTISSEGVFLHNGFLGSGVSVLSYDGYDVRIEYSKIREGQNISRIIGNNGEISFNKINEPTYYIIKSANGDAKTYHAPEDKSNMVSEISEFVRICECNRKRGEELLAVTEKTMAAVDGIYKSLGVDF